MSDLISRVKIHDYIQTQINPYGKPFEGTAYQFGLKIMDYIKNMSPVEPVRGEFKLAFTEKENVWKCSVCDNYWLLNDGTPFDNGMNFCPNCGADMRKKVEL